MLMFSTILNVQNLTKNTFLALLRDWNQSNPHKDTVIPGLPDPLFCPGTFGPDANSLSLMEHDKIIAARFRNTEYGQVIWDTNYVLNLTENRLAIRLERSCLDMTNFTTTPSFSSPYFISSLAQHGYLAKDDDLPVSSLPEYIDRDRLNLLADIILEHKVYRLPVVFLSYTETGRLPVNEKKLAARLRGIAHVVALKHDWLFASARRLCKNQNEHSGAAGIYFPGSVEHRRILFRDTPESDIFMANRIAETIISYHNLQHVDPMYTWSGVRAAALAKEAATQSQMRQSAEQEAFALVGSVDDEIQRYRQQIERLAKENELLRYEAQGLRDKIAAKEQRIPLLFLGDEEDLFSGEIREICIEALEDARKSMPEKSRRADVLQDILRENPGSGALNERKERIKTMFRSGETMSASIRKDLSEMGFQISEDGKHFRLIYCGDGRYHTTVSKSGSDHRGGKNIAAIITKMML